MSYLSYYKIGSYTDNNISEEWLSISNLKNVLKKLLHLVFNFFNKIIKWVKNLISNVFNQVNTTNFKDKLNSLFKLKPYLTNININIKSISSESYNDIFNNDSSDLNANNKYFNILNKTIESDVFYCSNKKNVFDEIFNLGEKWVFNITRSIEESKNIPSGNFTDKTKYNETLDKEDGLFKYFITDISSYAKKVGISRDIDTLLDPSLNLDSIYTKSFNFYKKYGKPLVSKLGRLNKEINDVNSEENFWLIKYELIAYSDILKISYYPLYLFNQYIKVLSEVFKIVKYSDILTTKDKPDGKLYHISLNGNILSVTPDNKFIPSYPKTGLFQLLPKRVCFAPGVINCCVGVPGIFRQDARYTKNDVSEIVLYLYEGIPDKNTRYIKSNIVKIAVGEAIYSNEICVTTPIKMRKVGKVVITYHASRVREIKEPYILDPSIFLDWELLEGSL